MSPGGQCLNLSIHPQMLYFVDLSEAVSLRIMPIGPQVRARTKYRGRESSVQNKPSHWKSSDKGALNIMILSTWLATSYPKVSMTH